jgi:sulfur-carrier protein
VEVRIRIPAQLRDVVAGAHVVDVEAGERPTVQAVLDVLAKEHPALERRLRDERGNVRTHVNVFVGDDNVRDLEGVATAVSPGQDVWVIPAVSGG